MSEQHGGDISSGFGDSEVRGPVSDEQAEKMLHGNRQGPPDDAPGDAEGGYSEQDVASNEQDLSQDG